MRITKGIMVQYERIRQQGFANMYDYFQVMEIATKLAYEELGALSLDEYKDILSTFGKYMNKFGLKQDSSIWEEST